MNRTTLFLLLFILAAIMWIMDLRRRLEAAQMRGDMYRDISVRLDRKVSELNAQ